MTEETEETEVCHFTDLDEKILPSVHITLIDDEIYTTDKSVSRYPVNIQNFIIMDHATQLNVADINENLLINLRGLKTDKSYVLRLNSTNFLVFFPIVQAIIEDSCNKYNVNIYAFFKDINKYAKIINDILINIEDRIYNNVFIVNYFFATSDYKVEYNSVIINCIYKDQQKKFLKVVNYRIGDTGYKPFIKNTKLDIIGDKQIVYTIENFSFNNVLFKIKEIIDERRCNFGRLFQISGSCWINATLNAFLLSGYNRRLMIERTKQLISIEQGIIDISVEKTINRYKCSFEDIKKYKESLNIDHIISSIVYNSAIEKKHYYNSRINDIMKILSVKIKSLDAYRDKYKINDDDIYQDSGYPYFVINYIIDVYLKTDDLEVKPSNTILDVFESALVDIQWKSYGHVFVYYTCNKKKYFYDSDTDITLETENITDYKKLYVKMLKIALINVEESIKLHKEVQADASYFEEHSKVVKEVIKNMDRITPSYLFIVIKKEDEIRQVERVKHPDMDYVTNTIDTDENETISNKKSLEVPSPSNKIEASLQANPIANDTNDKTMSHTVDSTDDIIIEIPSPSNKIEASLQANPIANDTNDKTMSHTVDSTDDIIIEVPSPSNRLQDNSIANDTNDETRSHSVDSSSTPKKPPDNPVKTRYSIPGIVLRYLCFFNKNKITPSIGGYLKKRTKIQKKTKKNKRFYTCKKRMKIVSKRCTKAKNKNPRCRKIKNKIQNSKRKKINAFSHG
jgi:hypothetical protein